MHKFIEVERACLLIAISQRSRRAADILSRHSSTELDEPTALFSREQHSSPTCSGQIILASILMLSELFIPSEETQRHSRR